MNKKEKKNMIINVITGHIGQPLLRLLSPITFEQTIF